jgi:hypothetical protein
MLFGKFRQIVLYRESYYGPYIKVEPEPANVGVGFAQGVGADAWRGGGGGSQDQVGVVFAATLAAAQDN